MEKKYTFLLPCLNEEKSLAYCIQEVQKCIKDKNLDAEILIADNNSTDNSVNIAKENNARVVICEKKGYGATLINGIKNARGQCCIMGDSDGSYDFYNIDSFIDRLNDNYDLVVGNRYKGGIKKGAMSLSHKVGVKFLSGFANLLFHTPIKDYHCGLRAFKKDSIDKLNLTQPGMEFASEMIIKAKINNLKMNEVPTTLKKDLRDGKTHLKTIRDGFRHLFLICKLSLLKN